MPHRPQAIPDAICKAARQRAARLREIACNGTLSAEHADELTDVAAGIESLADGYGPITPHHTTGYRLVYVGDHADDSSVTSLVDKLLPAVLEALDAGEKIMRYGHEFNACAPSVLVCGHSEWTRKLTQPLPPVELCNDRILYSAELHGARIEWIGYNFARI